MLLKDKIAVVTGANNGIGQAIVKVFLENGAKARAEGKTEPAHHN